MFTSLILRTDLMGWKMIPRENLISTEFIKSMLKHFPKKIDQLKNYETTKKKSELNSVAEPELLDRTMSRPNGIALNLKQDRLYVSNSDKSDPLWKAFNLSKKGKIASNEIFFDAKPLVKPDRVGVPDGMTVDKEGNVFASGPGGVHVFSPNGVILGSILTESKSSNAEIGGDGYLYITAHNKVLRIKLKGK
mmetsp:Transcript_17287/g.25629  ORF Transcript_17287/g.25629 Transcript_17287/m.25629 type:complete len:192 (-) Transcript_17287:2-577(-)